MSHLQKNSAVWQAKGQAAVKADHYKQAIHAFEKAIYLAKLERSHQQEIRLHQLLGNTHAIMQNWPEAVKYFGLAADLARQYGFEQIHVNALDLLCQAQTALGYASPLLSQERTAVFAQAAQTIQQLIDLLRDRHDSRKQLADAHMRLGNVKRGLGRLFQAEIVLKKALAIIREGNDAALEAKCLFELGYVKQLQSNDNAAIDYYQGAFARLQTDSLSTETKFMVELHQRISEAYMLQNETGKADRHIQEAIRENEGMKRPFQQSILHLTRGRILTKAGKYEFAIQQFETADTLLKTIPGNRAKLEAVALLGDMASCYRLMGRYQPALTTFSKAITRAKQIQDQVAVGKWYGSLGMVYEEVGDFENALTSHRYALTEFEQSQYTEGIINTHNNLGTTRYQEGLLTDENSRLFEEAKGHYQRALALAEQKPDSVQIANITGNLGIILMRTGHPDEAATQFKKAYESLKEVGNHIEAGHQLENLGFLFSEFLSDPAKAETYYKQAFAIARDYHDDDGLQITLQRLGDLQFKHLQQVPKAQHTYEEAVKLAERRRSTVAVLAHRAGLQAKSIDAYDGLIRILWEADNWEAAFDLTEKARARTYTEQIGLIQLPRPKTLKRHLYENEQKKIHALRKIDQQLRDATDPVARSQLAAERQRVYQSLIDLWTGIKDDGPTIQRYVAIRQGTPTSAKILQSWLDGEAGENTAVIVFYTLSHAVLCWIFRHKSPLKGVHLRISEKALSHYVSDFEKEVDPDHLHGLGSNIWSAKLSFEITKLASLLQGIEHLYLVSHGILHKIPIHALRMGKEILGEKIPVTYMPNAGMLTRQFAVDAPPTKRLAIAFGFTENEEEKTLFHDATQKVAAIFRTRPFIDAEASKTIFYKKVANADVIYLLCHGRFVQNHPLESGLRLRDGWLTARDIMALDLSGAIVILTACQGGMSQVNPGDELAGLSHAFLLAGATAVLSAHWNVQQKSAIEFVQRFNTAWHSNQKSLAEAYQEALKYVRHMDPDSHEYSYENPYFWAPFTLMGNTKHYNKGYRSSLNAFIKHRFTRNR